MIAPPIMIRRLKICFLPPLRPDPGRGMLPVLVSGSLGSGISGLGPLDPLWSLSVHVCIFPLFCFIRIYQDVTTGSAPKWCRTPICIGYDHVIPFQLRYFSKFHLICLYQTIIHYIGTGMPCQERRTTKLCRCSAFRIGKIRTQRYHTEFSVQKIPTREK